MIYVFLADGFEEVEALTPVDILRRAGKEVCTVGIGSQIIKGSHGISVVCDSDNGIFKCDDNVEMIILPGGMPGTLNLEADKTVQEAIDYCIDNDKYIAAICAAPSVLGHKGILVGKNATCFPGFEKELTGASYTGELVTVDGNIITGKGAGAAMKFALKLAEIMTTVEKAHSLEASLQCK